MRNSVFCWVIALLLLTGCSKSIDAPIEKGTPVSPATTGFTRYTIPKGKHYSDLSTYKPVETSEMKFIVRFDSSAIYSTESPGNQYDINKLYGFSDNNMDHHQYSARIGWRWSDGALRLFAYIYNAGAVQSAEISTVPIGTDIDCSIRATSTEYIFTVNGITEKLPRLSTTPKAKGYQLYPYFGGDEVAPHEIKIWVRE
jgi:hypothetical protein